MKKEIEVKDLKPEPVVLPRCDGTYIGVDSRKRGQRCTTIATIKVGDKSYCRKHVVGIILGLLTSGRAKLYFK